jgi:mono/diheme cytochrome c family protein
MCYKENVKQVAGIENIKLDGGLCQGNISLTQMKNDGWKVEDIKMSGSANGTNFTYIFKKNEKEYTALDMEKLEQKIVARIENNRREDEKERLNELKMRMSQAGKEKYINKCQSCHGEKAEIEAFGTARALVTLDLADINLSINQYKSRLKDNGNGLIMTPYAKTITSQDVRNIYSYILTLKDENKDENKDTK